MMSWNNYGLDKYSKAKVELFSKESIFDSPSVLDLLTYNPKEIGAESDNFIELNNQFAYRNIDLNDFVNQEMIEGLNKISSEEEFYNSDYFKAVVNGYYNSLSEKNKEEFWENLSSEKGLRIYDALNVSSKENKINDRLKISLICRDIDKEPKKSLDMLASLYGSNEMLECISAIRNNKEISPINLSEEELGEIVKRIEESKLVSTNGLPPSKYANKKYELAFYSLISNDSKTEYLLSNPEMLGGVVDSLDENAFEEILGKTTDEALKGRMLLTCSKKLDDIKTTLRDIEDYFISGQIVLGKHQDSALSIEDAEKNIREYEKVRNKFLSLPQDEKIQYLCGIDKDITADDRAHMIYNEMKKSLIKHVDIPEDRKKVIDSMQRYVEQDFKPYDTLIQQMIREYFEDKGSLTPEMKEKMEIVFNSTDAFFTDYSNSDTTGKCSYTDKTISISNNRRGKDLEIILDLTHEYSHAFSNFYWLANSYNPGNIIEEGMCDLFSEQVVNHYLEKHKSIEINGHKYDNDGKPLRTTSTYFYENGIAKTLIYPLEHEGQDVKAIAEYTLGSKKRFLEVALGEEYADQYSYTSLGEPLNFSNKFSYIDVYYAHERSYKNADRESLYSQKNFLLPAFTILERAKEINGVSIGDTVTTLIDSMDKCLSHLTQEQLEQLSYNPEDFSEAQGIVKLMQKYNIREMSEEEKNQHLVGVHLSTSKAINEGTQQKSLGERLLEEAALSGEGTNIGLGLSEVARASQNLLMDMQRAQSRENKYKGNNDKEM